MATAYYSSSTLPTLQTNDVYISFRGDKSRCRLVSHLQDALHQRKIQSYTDSQLQKGDEISGSLMKAIQESKLSIIIFSENYADSSWCLDELAKILECKKEFGQLVIPLYDGVDPSDVRKQRGAYAVAFAMHEKRFKHDPDKLLKWRDALTRAGNLCGWDSRMYSDANFVQALTDDVLKLLVSIGKKILEENGTSEQSVETATAVDDKSKDSYPILPSQLNDDCLESISNEVTYYKDLTDEVSKLLVSIDELKLANGDSDQSVETAVDDESQDSYPDKLSQLHDSCLERILKKDPYYKDFVAFPEICTNMATAYYSSSTLPTLQTNDVYISFRGDKSRCRLVSHLQDALHRKKIQSYIDSQLQKGDEISGSHMKAIQESKLSIIIFSENYADSSWCLDELAKILECKKEFGQLVIPLYDGVDPSEVRTQRGAYADAFYMHEKRFKHDPDKLLKWRDALTRAAGLCGWDSRMYSDANFVQALTDDVLKLLVSIGKKILEENGTSEQSVETATAVDDKSKDSYPILPSQLNDDCLESISNEVTYYKDLTDEVSKLLVSIDELKLANGDSDQSVETAVDDESQDSYPDKLSQLHDSCLERILKKVPYYKDFVAFSEVCHSSRSVCSNMEWDEGPKPPCLMLSENSGSSSHSFFNLHNNNGFILELPAVVRRRIWGSSYGWLVTVDTELEAQLLNPISEACINLPPFPSMHNRLSRKNQFRMIHKILVFKIKIDKFLVMVIFNPEDQVAFTRVPGDGEWIWISNPEKLLFRDISYLRGQDQVYALCDDGSLVRIEFAFHNISGKMSSTVNELVKLMEFSGPVSAKVKLIAAHPIGESVGPLPEMERTGRAYLVASRDDDLFGVFRYSEGMGSDQRTVEFAVYKFNPRGVGWESVISIRDKAFFVGNNTSWSIFSANTVNCRNNSIYFTDDNWELEWLHNVQGLDIGVYDMETRRTEGLGFGVSTSTSSLVCSTWITPGLTPNFR